VTIQELVGLVTDGGVIALLILILVGGHRRWWVWGWLHKETVADRDEWKQLALRGTGLAETATSAARKAIEDA
jgi:hypothetical protein